MEGWIEGAVSPCGLAKLGRARIGEGREREKAKVEPKPRQQSVTVVEWRQRGSLATATDATVRRENGRKGDW